MSSDPKPTRRRKFSDKSNSVDSSSSAADSTSADVDAASDRMIDPTTSARSNPASSVSARRAILTASRTRNDAFLENLYIRYGNLGAMQIAQMKQWLLDFVKKGNLVPVAKAVMEFIKAHPWKVLGSLGFIFSELSSSSTLWPIHRRCLAGDYRKCGCRKFFCVSPIRRDGSRCDYTCCGVAVAGSGVVALAKVAGALQPASRWVQNTATTAWQWIKTRWAWEWKAKVLFLVSISRNDGVRERLKLELRISSEYL
ncbi:hypothetical protein B0H13DRAFT_2275381 [Mycena leptocephala]|nr:hypothetical protein B0H13DRAFT_2275381 [Mycena leptocephala]